MIPPRFHVLLRGIRGRKARVCKARVRKALGARQQGVLLMRGFSGSFA